jgi:hypothetical protein
VELILSVVTQDTRYPPKKSDRSLDSGVETPLTMKWQCPSARDVPDFRWNGRTSDHDGLDPLARLISCLLAGNQCRNLAPCVGKGPIRSVTSALCVHFGEC